MTQRLMDLPDTIRARTADAIRQRERALTDDAAAAFAGEPRLDMLVPRESVTVLLACLASAIERGTLDPQDPAMSGFSRVSPSLTIRVFVDALQRLERAVLDDLAVDGTLGAMTEPWGMVAHSVRAGILEMIAVFAERDGCHAAVRDELTTLFARPVFDAALAQEISRAQRHAHGVVMLVFDIDGMAHLNERAGHGTGDLLLQRLGIVGRHYFRTHDWVARHGADSIAVLLPQTTIEQAAALATQFLQTIEQRLVLTDHHTGRTTRVTVSAAVVGADAAHAGLDAEKMSSEAEAAVTRAALAGGNRTERVQCARPESC